MLLQVSDRFSDSSGEWEVVARPYTTAGGKSAILRTPPTPPYVLMLLVATCFPGGFVHALARAPLSIRVPVGRLEPAFYDVAALLINEPSSEIQRQPRVRANTESLVDFARHASA